MRNYNYIVLLAILPCIFVAGLANAATINANTCNRADVLTAWNAASDGDTIAIPSGACTWTTSITMNSSSSRTKMVKLIGAGTDPSTGTRITANASGAIFNIWLSHMIAPLEISDIRFIEGSSWTNADEEAVWAIALLGHADTQTSLFRIHHNVFVQNSNNDNCCNGNIVNSMIVGGANSYGSPDNGRPYIWGLFDHNTWTGPISFQVADVMPRYDTGANGTNIVGCSGSCNYGHLAWRDWTIADHQGTWRNVFYEDNVFAATAVGINNAALDAGVGGALVARHNTFTNTWMSGHGPDTLGGARGTKWTEVYDNKFVTSSSIGGGWVMATMYKSGTGVTYNNTFWDHAHQGTGNPKGIPSNGIDFAGPFVNLTYRRAEGTTYGAPPCQACACGDETTTTCDNKDSTTDPGKGRICWDQPGAKRGPDAPGRTLGYSFSQEPVVYWNNTWSDTATKIVPQIYGDDPPTAAQVATYIQERREYIFDTSCAGHMGETVCAAFWDATNTKKLNYTAYTYPHPLTTGTTGSTDQTPPIAPLNLRVQ